MRKGMIKRFLALVVSSAMVLSTAAFAEEFTVAEPTAAAEVTAEEYAPEGMQETGETEEEVIFSGDTGSEEENAGTVTETPEENDEVLPEPPAVNEEEAAVEEKTETVETEETIFFDDAETENLLNAGVLEDSVNAKGKREIRYKQEDGTYLQSEWLTIDDALYYFNDKGLALVNVVKKLVGPKGTEGIYYFQENGQVYKDGYAEVVIKGETCYYYFAKNGQAYTKCLRTVVVDGVKEHFYFLANGKAFTNGLRSVEVNGEKQYYYFQKNGIAVKKALITNVPVKDKSCTMYFQKNGQAAKNTLKKLNVAGKNYYFCFQANGTAAVNKIQGVPTSTGDTAYYYLDADGHAVTGKWITKDGHLYAYAYGNGKLATGVSSVGGVYCHFSSKGVVQAGWYDYNGSMTYFQGEKAELYISSTAMYNAWQKIRNESSGSSYYICTDLSAVRVFIFTGSAGNWKPLYSMICSPGAPETPTVTGHFVVQDRGYSFGSSTYTCYYYTQFYGNYLFHSVLYDADTFNIQDGRLGEYLSHGCVRMDINDAKWIYDNIPEGTDVEVYW